jgi:hypothetical protein
VQWNTFWSSGNPSVRLRMQSYTLHATTWSSHFCSVSTRSKAVRWNWCLFLRILLESIAPKQFRVCCKVALCSNIFTLLPSVQNNTVIKFMRFLNSGVCGNWLPSVNKHQNAILVQSQNIMSAPDNVRFINITLQMHKCECHFVIFIYGF